MIYIVAQTTTVEENCAFDFHSELYIRMMGIEVIRRLSRCRALNPYNEVRFLVSDLIPSLCARKLPCASGRNGEPKGVPEIRWHILIM